MKFRWTTEDLAESDYEVLRRLVTERYSGLNPYSPLTKRLQELHGKLERQEQLTKKD